MAEMAHSSCQQRTVDEWFVYSHSLHPGKAYRILKSEKTALGITAEKGAFKAEFELASGNLSIDLHRNLLDVPSYAGDVERDENRKKIKYRSRIIAIHYPDLNLRALIGHISLVPEAANGPFRRDFFFATREERTAEPPIDSFYQFEDRVHIPLHDHHAPHRGTAIQLSKSLITVEQRGYMITFTPSCGGLQFRSSEDPKARVGGVVLPLAPDQPEHHLLLVGYHHLHTSERHAGCDGMFDPVAGVPGHPLCTNLFAGYQTL